MARKYFAKCTRACKTPGLPQSKVGRDMDGFYTYPCIGHYPTEADATLAMGILANRFPKAGAFVESHECSEQEASHAR